MPHDPENNEVQTDIDPERARAAAAIGKNAEELTDDEFEQLSKPGVKEIIDKQGDSAFIDGLSGIVQEAIDRKERQARRAPENQSSGTRSKLKIAGVALAGMAALVGVGTTVMQLGGPDKSETSISLANIDRHLVDDNAPETEKAQFFSLTPSTHGMLTANDDPYSLRSPNEALFSYDGSEQSRQEILDDFSNMFRRDVQIQAWWASALKSGDAPRLPSLTDLQNEQVFWDYHAAMNAYSDRLAGDIKLRTAVYNENMRTLAKADFSAGLKQAEADHASIQHDGNRVSIAKRVGSRGKDAMYHPFISKNDAGEDIAEAYMPGCGQWMKLFPSSTYNVPTHVLTQTTRPETPPPPTTIAPPPSTSVPPTTTTTTPTTEWTPTPTPTPTPEAKITSQNPGRVDGPLPEVVINGPGQYVPTATFEAPPPPPPATYTSPRPTSTVNRPAPDSTPGPNHNNGQTSHPNLSPGNGSGDNQTSVGE